MGISPHFRIHYLINLFYFFFLHFFFFYFFGEEWEKGVGGGLFYNRFKQGLSQGQDSSPDCALPIT